MSSDPGSELFGGGSEQQFYLPWTGVLTSAWPNDPMPGVSLSEGGSLFQTSKSPTRLQSDIQGSMCCLPTPTELALSTDTDISNQPPASSTPRQLVSPSFNVPIKHY